MKNVVASVLFFFLMPSVLFAAAVSVIPSSGVAVPSVVLSLDTGGGCVVAGEIVIEYDAELFTPALIDRENSVFTLWLPDATSTGRVSLSGGVPGGFCGAFSGEGIVTSIASFSFVPLTSLTSLAGHVRIGTTSTLYDGSGQRVDTIAAR